MAGHLEKIEQPTNSKSFHGEVFEGMEHLFEVTKCYLEDYYNFVRMHTSLSFKSPQQYERMAA